MRDWPAQGDNLGCDPVRGVRQLPRWISCHITSSSPDNECGISERTPMNALKNAARMGGLILWVLRWQGQPT